MSHLRKTEAERIDQGEAIKRSNLLSNRGLWYSGIKILKDHGVGTKGVLNRSTERKKTGQGRGEI